MSMKRCVHTYKDIISLENLLDAWKEFQRGKKNKIDVQEFERNLMENILNLHNDLKHKTYTHSAYKAFKIHDPKSRDIHKAQVKDRLVHHAIYRVLYAYFDTKFVHDSYSCRLNKGTHKATKRFEYFAHKVSQNNTKTCWVLKCDIRKFFVSIDHDILLGILKKHIQDTEIISLLTTVITSFYSTREGKGLPLGNLTSQLLVNIYMNEFDQWIKQTIKVKNYSRYADDFVVLHTDKEYLRQLISHISEFLSKNLKLSPHPNKVSIQTYASGVDFLGWIHFPKYKILRTNTKKRMFKNLHKNEYQKESVSSYLGLLSHGNTYAIRQVILENRNTSLGIVLNKK